MSDQPTTTGGSSTAGGTPSSVAPQGSAPASVSTAVTLMYIRAAIALIGIVLLLGSKNTLKRDILKHNPSANSARLDSLLNSAIAIGIVGGLVFIVLYVLLAMQVRKGKSWARIVTWVLAGLGVLGALASLAQVAPPLNHVAYIVEGLIDVAIIVLLAKGDSNAYFRQTA